MGAWGYYKDQNDSVSDEWENIIDAYIAKNGPFSSSEECVRHIRKHPKRWYKLLKVHILKVIKEREWNAQSEEVAVGLIIQTVRILTAPRKEVSDYAQGFPGRIARIQKSMNDDVDSLDHLPPEFPESLRFFAYVWLTRFLQTLEKDDGSYVWKDIEARKSVLLEEIAFFEQQNLVFQLVRGRLGSGSATGPSSKRYEDISRANCK